MAYLQELRLENMESLDLNALSDLADHSGSHKLRRAVRAIEEMARTSAEEYETL
jgi:hypothetical protein